MSSVALRVPVLGDNPDAYVYVGHGQDCVLVAEHEVPKWRNAFMLTPAAARELAAILIQQADASEQVTG